MPKWKMIINIELQRQDSKLNNNQEVVAELFNMIGEQKGYVKITNNIASINTTSLSKGIYILKINIDDKIENHQVVIE